MAIEIEATYENGILRLDEPLPLNEHERVVVTVRATASRQSEDDQARRREARERMLGLFARIDDKTRKGTDDEMDAAVEEALQFVRGGRGG